MNGFFIKNKLNNFKYNSIAINFVIIIILLKSNT
jgi:hypothetical protein